MNWQSHYVQRLLPGPAAQVPLGGLYLGHDLLGQRHPDRPYCFSNFVVSIDGRISLSAVPGAHPKGVPASLSSPGDWRLFQELVAQSDAVLVSGRYVREVGGGDAEPLIQLDRPGMEDLAAWRNSMGIGPAPRVVVVSASLDFSPRAALRLGSDVLVATDAAASEQQRTVLRSAGIDVVTAGETGVEGSRLIRLLAERGFRTVYAAAGPSVFHLLVDAGALDRLYVTCVAKMLGGTSFATLVEGDAFDPPVGFALDELYLDGGGHADAAQTFAVYRPAGVSSRSQ